MDSAMNNSLIAMKIFGFLDHEDQMACRLVSPTWKKHMDQPSFWIKKCDQRGQSQELHDAWYDLLRRIKEAEEGSYLQQEFLECLMKWHGKIKSIQKKGTRWYRDPYVLSAPIHVAASCGVSSILQFIIANSPEENPNHADLWGVTSFHLAAAEGHTEIVKFLTTVIENPNPADSFGETPIHEAAYEGHTEIVKFLASKVENPNTPNHCGVTPLHLATFSGQTETAKFLASIVENSNTQDQWGQTPLDLCRICIIL